MRLCKIGSRSQESGYELSNGPLLITQVLNVNVGAQPGVVGEVPPGIVRIVVEDDVVTVPQPFAGVVVVIWGDAKEKAAKPEAVPAATLDTINVITANLATKATMLPRMIEVVMGIVAATFVTNPAIAFGVNVRSLRVALLVAIGGARSFFVSAICGSCGASRGAGWAVSRNVTTADVRGACRGVGLTATAGCTATSRVLLSESGQC